jgi:hypothetical protein
MMKKIWSGLLLFVFSFFMFTTSSPTSATTTSYLPEGDSSGYKQIKLLENLITNKASETKDAVTGGDGLQPIPYRADDGSLRIWNIYHHADYRAPVESLPTITCSNPATGQACDLNGDSQPDTDKYYIRSDSGNIHQPQSNFYSNTRYMEQSNGGTVVGSRLYVDVEVYDQANPTMDDPNTTTDEASRFDVYKYCFDMETATKCGFTKLNDIGLRVRSVEDAGGTPYATIAEDRIALHTSGSQLIDGKMYSTTISADSDVNGPTIYCFNPASSSTCGNYEVDSLKENITDRLAYPIRSHSDGTNIYLVAGWNGNTISNIDTKACVVAATLTPCSGYNKDTTGPAADFGARGSFMVGPNLCTLLYRGKSTITNSNKHKAYSDLVCYDSSGNSISSSAISSRIDSIMTTSTPAVDPSDPDITSNYFFEGPSPENYYDKDTGKAYINFYWAWTKDGETIPVKTYALCVDVQSMSPCSGFADNGVIDWNQVAGKEIQSYGYNKDDQGCMWELGDRGDLISFNPLTGSIPCLKSLTEATVDVTEGLCDSTKGRYVYAKLNNIDWSKVTSSYIEVYDATGGLIETANPAQVNGQSQTIDLSAYTTSGNTSTITVKVFIDATDETWDDQSPNVEVVYAPDTDNQKPFGTEGAGNPLTTIKVAGSCIAPTTPKTGAVLGAAIASVSIIGMTVLIARELMRKRTSNTTTEK